STDEAAPVHWESLPPLDAAPELPAGTTPLSDVVKAPDALARRLSQVGLVDDGAAARRLQRDLKPGQRLVTREGALFRWDGFTVAAGAPTASAQRLEQRNRLGELRTELKRAEAEKLRLSEAHAQAKHAAEEATAQERASRDELSAAYNRVNEARASETRVAQEAAHRQSKLSTLLERGERLDADLRESEQGLAEARSARDGLPDLTAARAQLTELRAALAEKRTLLAERQSAVDRLIREAEARTRRLAAIAEEKRSWSARLEAAQRHLQGLQERRTAAEAELEEIAGKPGSFAEQREALAEKISDAETRRKAAADALAEGETRLTGADRALKETESELAQAREERVRAEAARDGANEALSRLKERVRERLECRLDDLAEVAELDPSQDLPERDEIETKLQRLTRERENIGPVNLRAEHEARELEEQIQGMQNERADLTGAIARLRQGIASLNREGRERLLNAFEAVDQHFSELFVRLFGGGRAHLKLTEAEDPLEAGLEIMASPPGKRLQVMSLLSGGEQALTALALLFAVFLTNPAPICVLDEVDAPLDDANVDRFCTLVSELADTTETRFLVITHHRMTMSRVDRLFGVTMGERGVSQLVSVDLQAAESLRESA
ncbi:MAG: chromosome segregation protein SMC, partial [Rhodovibrionaceae bacterium]|nr:chromosome segregation protein SMC [Rhodovibrionaceae bacterium]